MSQANTLYAILGVERDASDEGVAAAYVQRLNAAQAAGEETALLRAAYDSLRTPELRAAYDRKLARQAAASVIEQPDHPSVRSFSFGGLILMLILACGAYYWWNKSRAKFQPQTAPAIKVVQEAPKLANKITLEDESAPISVPTSERIEPSVGAMSEQQLGPIVMQPQRPQCKTGFDPRCLAWSVFLIRQRNSSGSGVLIGPDRILTNCHVLAGGALNGLVVIHTQTNTVAKVEKYARLGDEDACLLYAPGAGGEVLPWGNSANLKYGDTIYSLGHPGGSGDVVWSEGKYLERLEIGREQYLKTAHYCRPGSSGGPLLDDQGRLVGIVTAGQRLQSANGDVVGYGACLSVTEVTARGLLSRSLFPIAMAPAQHFKNY